MFEPGSHAFRGLTAGCGHDTDFRFVRFRPPQLEQIRGRHSRLAPHSPRPRDAIPVRGPIAMTEDVPQAGSISASTIRASSLPSRKHRAARELATLATGRNSTAGSPTRSPIAHGVWRWGTLFWSALSGLVLLALGIAVTNFVEESVRPRAMRLAPSGSALALLAGIALLALIVREIIRPRPARRPSRRCAIARLTTIESDDRERGPRASSPTCCR